MWGSDKGIGDCSPIGPAAMITVIGLMEFCGRPVSIVAGVLATQKALVLKHPIIASIDIGALVKINALAYFTNLDRAKLAPQTQLSDELKFAGGCN